MEKIKPLEVRVFHKVDRPDIRLYLCKGIVLNEDKDALSPNGDRYRWMIKGLRSPFPVRNGTWFEGFEPSVMKKYLADNGYAFAEVVPVHYI